jgi:hypothetical protein
MRSRLLGSVGVCLVFAYGCGASKPSPPPSSTPDAGDAAAAGDTSPPGDGRPGDGADGAPESRGEVMPGLGGAGGQTDGGGHGGDGGDVDARGAGGRDGGTDAALPTCSDGVRNSDETDIDCGGHCGPCAAGRSCKVGLDCQFGLCTAELVCGSCNVASDCAGAETECQHRTCAAGVCGIALDAPGTPLALQIIGDCRSRQCGAAGDVVIVDDDSDAPDDGNPCTNDLCGGGTPSHSIVAAGTSCGGDNHCNAGGQCIGCVAPSDCPGTDGACATRTCSGQGICGFDLKAAGSVLADPTAGDCKGLICDGRGNAQAQNDDGDLPADGNLCTTDECNAGTPSHRPIESGISCGTNMVCDGASHCLALCPGGACMSCTVAADCPGGPDTECHMRSCTSSVCGVGFPQAGTPLVSQTAGDCHRQVCDGIGNVDDLVDDTDVPDDAQACTQDSCAAGAPSNTPLPARSACGAPGSLCDGAGVCLQCLVDADCGTARDTACNVDHCVAGACALQPEPAGPAPGSLSGDCHTVSCDGAGGLSSVVDDSDVPVDGNGCTQDLCTNGVPSNPRLATAAACALPSGSAGFCDASGLCSPSFMLVRVGDGSAAPTGAATRVLVERRLASDATLVGSPIALPMAASGSAQQPFTLSGTGDSEGHLALSGDGRYLTLAGYSAIPGGSTSTVPRVVARIDAAGAVDTSTTLGATALVGDNARSAVTSDGSMIWAAGNAASNSNRGVFFTNFGTGAAATRLVSLNTRVCQIFFAQLYCTTNAAFTSVGSGLPELGSITPVTVAPSGANSFGFVMFDLDPVDGAPDTLYIADQGATAITGGVQKWQLQAGAAGWAQVGTFNVGLPAASAARGLTGFVSGSSVVLIATTGEMSPASNAVAKFVDDGTPAALTRPAVIFESTRQTNTIVHGVALPPHP